MEVAFDGKPYIYFIYELGRPQRGVDDKLSLTVCVWLAET